MAASQQTHSQALVKRQSASDVSLMPPPPFKRIKRPPKVLDEDEYTTALSEIIARDYFPGLLESQAQHEYLAALDSGNESWIAEAAQKLRNAGAPFAAAANKRRSSARNTRFDDSSRSNFHTPSATPRGRSTATASGVADTPVGFYAGSETPVSVSDIGQEQEAGDGGIDTSNLSLGAFQAKYTSEDNESFNTLLDKQNLKRRQKHAYMWTQDQRVPSARLIAYRAHKEARLLKQRGEDGIDQQETGDATAAAGTGSGSGNGGIANIASTDNGADKQTTTTMKDMVIPSMTTGATDARPARPDAWRIKRPDNTFMFPATSIDEDVPGLQTVQEAKEQLSKIGPKHVMHANTRFPPVHYLDDGPVPPSPSLNTDIIARRDAAKTKKKGTAAASESESDLETATGMGGETPRVNGYAFVDEDEPENIKDPDTTHPSYRDLLAGQFDGNAMPNPFKIGEIRKREELHLRMVENQAKLKRAKDRDTVRPVPGGVGVGGSTSTSGPRTRNDNATNMTPTPTAAAAAAGNMTPAARRLMEKLGGRTPLRAAAGNDDDRTGGGITASTPRNMWTPVRTPRRKK
ncbi:hypothetical protein A1O1_07519 [Capronia coronata CBS 617.96]|uniref:Nuclear protein DGCR14 n=1 Tax=Capronia coronata CBS 617.96 TaxID=1182541 RepID=W9Y2P8_9EURO|nr:uncharacterized protein A1O1_07519 [Capronia coronata CBS 617.96]EXJ83890.1 hypothetical protein A1O1_07519 [Capronia coronata CBS 617.96]